jgi:hypothetical protein
MGYTITSCTLQSMLDLTTSVRLATNLLTTKARISAGTLCKLEFVVTNTANYLNNSFYIFNPFLFAPTQRTTALETGGWGWVVKLVNVSGTLTPFIDLRNNGAEHTVKNYVVQATLTAPTVLTVKFFFYAAQQYFDYINPDLGISTTNRQKLLNTAIGQNQLDNTNLTAYRAATSYLEFLFFETDALFVPTAGDPYARQIATYKQFSGEVALGWFDNVPAALQNYTGTVLTKNNLSSILVSIIGLSKITEITRRDYPVLLQQNDANFEILSNRLALNITNSVSVTIKCPEFVPTRALVRLLKVDTANLVDEQEMVIEYEIDTAEIASGVVPGVGWLNGGTSKFGTPSNGSFGATTTLDFKIDGTRLVFGSRYRLWLGLYDGAFLESSSLSPDIIADLDAPPYADMQGLIETSGDTQDVGNDLTFASNERFRLSLAIDSSTFTLANFTALLKSITLQTYNAAFGNLIETSFYDFQNATSGSNPEITLQVIGTVYVFSVLKRAPYNPLLTTQSYRHLWRVLYEYPTTGGATQPLIYEFDQFTRNPAIDTARIIAIRFYNYNDFINSIFTEITSICSSDEFVVVEIEKNAAPDAKLQAILVLKQASSTLIGIEEEESYTPLYLPISSSDALQDVDATFGDNKAYYAIQINQLPSNFNIVRAGAIIINI